MSGFPDFPDAAQQSTLSAIRQSFHREPELSWTEFRTSARLCAELSELGFDVLYGKALYGERKPPNPPEAEVTRQAYARAEAALGRNDPHLAAMAGNLTGLCATLDSGRPGPVWGFRFDIDALPIQESRDPSHPPAEKGFASDNPGVMHACGHDGHLTIGLGLAQRLAATREQWCGRVHLFFQPAEEVGGGGVVFADLPQLHEVERFMTLHLGIVDAYQIICDATWICAKIYDVRFQGRASHAGNAPQDGRNALLAACQAVQGLYALPRHSGGLSRINVGRFHSANAHNVIADDVCFRYEVRGANNDVADYMAQQAEQVLAGAAMMNGVEYEKTTFAEFSGWPNSPELAAKAETIARDLGLPEELLQRPYLVPASEDAGYMVRQVRDQGGLATHLILGCPVGDGHHSCAFDFDERLLPWGVEMFYRMVADGEVK
ncbi:amidohydrolase [Hahella sp. CR1]|uniref:amidohydrolase n=1 Tax=Hahella sp. CR1 TaxID=2992807 RepID=UPI002442BC14|nr:amidohydrolase [Hahella sp. CR1]MDG9667154.1 amidohydrolase [Hahella sp. CR1]